MSSKKEVCLDGRHLEGGGQLLRLAAGLAAVTNTPLRVTSIRGNRPGGGGLRSQHLRAVEFLAAATSAECEGAEIKSRVLSIKPSAPPTDVTSLPTSIQIGSPGSICLVIQAILPYLLFAGSRHQHSTSPEPITITIHGGTNVSHSPSVEYLQHVLLPTLAKIGISGISAHLNARGWTGRSSQLGSVTLAVTPLPRNTSLPAWSLTQRGTIARIEVHALMSWRYHNAIKSATSSLIRSRISSSSSSSSNNSDIPITTSIQHHPHIAYLLLIAVSEHGHRLAADHLWTARISSDSNAAQQLPQRMAEHAVAALAAELAHGGCVDAHMRDQLVVFQALAERECCVDYGRDDEQGGVVRPSLHAQTAVWVTEELLGVSWTGNESCRGAGFRAGWGDAAPSTDELVSGVDNINLNPS